MEAKYARDRELTSEFESLLEEEARRYAKYASSEVGDVLASLIARDAAFEGKVEKIVRRQKRSSGPCVKRHRRMKRGFLSQYGSLFQDKNKRCKIEETDVDSVSESSERGSPFFLGRG